jgi:ABC-type sugar transport system permease subunit
LDAKNSLEMTEMLTDVLVLVAVFVAIVFTGAVLVSFARWAKKRNAHHKSLYGRFKYTDFPEKLSLGRRSAALDRIFFGDQESWSEFFGKSLAWLAIAAVVGTLLWVGIALAFR